MNKFTFILVLIIANFISITAKVDKDSYNSDNFFWSNYSNDLCSKTGIMDFKSNYLFSVKQEMKPKDIKQFYTFGDRSIYSENSDSTSMIVYTKDEKGKDYDIKFKWNEDKSKLLKVTSIEKYNIEDFNDIQLFLDLMNIYQNEFQKGTGLKLNREPSDEDIKNFPIKKDQLSYTYSYDCNNVSIDIQWILFAVELYNKKSVSFYCIINLSDKIDEKANLQKEKERQANLIKKRKSLSKNEINELTNEFNELKYESKKLKQDYQIDSLNYRKKADYYTEEHLSKKLSKIENKLYKDNLDEISQRMIAYTIKIKMNQNRINEIKELLPKIK